MFSCALGPESQSHDTIKGKRLFSFNLLVPAAKRLEDQSFSGAFHWIRPNIAVTASFSPHFAAPGVHLVLCPRTFVGAEVPHLLPMKLS